MRVRSTPVILLIIILAICTCLFCACDKHGSDETDIYKIPDDSSKVVSYSPALNNNIFDTLKELYGLSADVSIADYQAEIDTYISYFTSAKMEEAEVYTLLGIISDGADVYNSLIDAFNTDTLDASSVAAVMNLMKALSDSVGADVTGKLFYAVASARIQGFVLPRNDCIALARAVFGLDMEISAESLSAIINTDGFSALTADEQLLILGSIADVLEGLSVVNETTYGYISDTLLAFLESADCQEALESYEYYDEYAEYFTSLKSILTDCAPLLKENVSVVINYAVQVLRNAQKVNLIGYTWDKKEVTVYYGYRYSDWSKTLITAEAYQDHIGGFDEYICVREVADGYYSNGVFYSVTAAQQQLGDTALMMQWLYSSYDCLSAQDKTVLREMVENTLRNAGDFQDEIALLFSLEQDEDAEIAVLKSFEDVIAALNVVLSVELYDGISAAEQAAVENCKVTLQDYLKAYVPELVSNFDE